MSDRQRSSSLVSPSRFTRTDWPRSYARGTSTSSRHSQAPSLIGSNHFQMSWEQLRGTSSTPSSSGTPLPWKSSVTASGTRSTSSTFGLVETDSAIRQWSFMGLEWIVLDVHKLRDFVEGDSQSATAAQSQSEDFEILRRSPIMGDKYKLQIVCTPLSEETLHSTRQTLSLYLTSLVMDFAQRSEYEMATTMMVAIRCHDTRADNCSLRADWVWQFWQYDWVFRQESEVWGKNLSGLVWPATDLFVRMPPPIPV